MVGSDEHIGDPRYEAAYAVVQSSPRKAVHEMAWDIVCAVLAAADANDPLRGPEAESSKLYPSQSGGA